MWALFQILRHGTDVSNKHDSIIYRPELYAGAGGEMLVLTMGISWLLTAIYKADLIASNPLKDRVGYNNLCVGWDEAPARYVAAPLFALIVWFEGRFMMLDYWRASLNPDLSKFKKHVILIANFLSALSWFCSSLIFVISPMESAGGHTASFVQLVVFTFFAYVANFVETPHELHPRGSWVFLVVYGIVSVSFFMCALIQFVAYDREKGIKGPIPWYVTATSDYAWFGCLFVQGYMRPSGDDVQCKLSLTGPISVPTAAGAVRGNDDPK